MAGARSARHMRKVTEWASQSVEPWAKAGVRPNQLLIQPLLGGLSNVLHSVEITDAALTRTVMRAHGPAKLLVRTFEASPTLVDPAQEQIIFEACGKTGLSPRMWAVDREGKGLRAEEFLDGDTMTLDQLRLLDVQLRQAPVIAMLHSVKVPLDDSRPWIRHKAQSWLKAAMDVVPKLGGNRAAAFRKLEGMGSLRNQVMWYTDELLPSLEKLYGAKALGGIGTPGVDQPLDVVFCHNDLQEGNWLIQDDNEMRVIDYEYGGYNYRSYDISNLYCECGYDYSFPDYPFFRSSPESIPRAHQREQVWRAYISALRRQHAVACGADEAGAEITSRVEGEEDEALIAAYQRVAPAMAMGAHLAWTLWGIILAYDDPDIDFGYMDHSISRFGDYLRVKDDLLKEGVVGEGCVE